MNNISPIDYSVLQDLALRLNPKNDNEALKLFCNLIEFCYASQSQGNPNFNNADLNKARERLGINN